MTTYGPGSILEGRNGPRLIPSLEIGLNLKQKWNFDTLKNYVINESRLRAVIGSKNKENGNVIFSLPTNASLHLPANEPIYKTLKFPKWKICYGIGGKHNVPILYEGDVCPVCKTDRQSTSVRFIMACINGHLDDVNWHLAVHKGKDNRCKPDYYKWKAGGSSLSDIKIECPICMSSTTMDKVYRQDFKCTGRFPEREDENFGKRETGKRRQEECNVKMKVIQRQSSSLRIPISFTLLTIPDYDDKFSKLIQRDDIISIAIKITLKEISSDETIKEEELVNKIKENLNLINNISNSDINVIVDYMEKNGFEKFKSHFQRINSSDRTFTDFINEEFESLTRAEGNPLQYRSDNFIMGPPVKAKLKTKDRETELMINPVERLRTITVQYGYIRIPYQPSGEETEKTVISGSLLENKMWFPGFEGRGEGIFIKLIKGKTPDLSQMKALSEWNNYPAPPDGLSDDWNNIRDKPLFVWLHTLSHAIMLAISLYAGYSSASLRERIYVNENGDDGGILIYTSSMGDDGSMGGLAGSVQSFQRILDEASRRIQVCSNDPLCSDVRKVRESVNGAACYSCLMVSETSCEHMNKWLDRHMINGD